MEVSPKCSSVLGVNHVVRLSRVARGRDDGRPAYSLRFGETVETSVRQGGGPSFGTASVAVRTCSTLLQYIDARNVFLISRLISGNDARKGIKEMTT